MDILNNVRKLGQICNELGKCCSNMEGIILKRIKSNNSSNVSTTSASASVQDNNCASTHSQDEDFLQENPFVKWTCAICSRKFRTEKILKDHKHSRHEGKRFPCTHCSKSFASENSLNVHCKWHTKDPT